MSAIVSKVDICNLAIGGLGNRNTISNIDTPKTDKEIVMALWYDISRQLLLKTMMPNFALDRVLVSQKALPTAYVGVYAYCYEYPQYALKILGIGSIDEKDLYPFIVEGNSIYTDAVFTGGLPIRIVRDITTVPSMSVEFILALAKELEKRTAAPITQDPSKKKTATVESQVEQANATALNAQENRPVRQSISRFSASRSMYQSMNTPKK